MEKLQRNAAGNGLVQAGPTCTTSTKPAHDLRTKLFRIRILQDSRPNHVPPSLRATERQNQTMNSCTTGKSCDNLQSIRASRTSPEEAAMPCVTDPQGFACPPDINLEPEGLV